MKLRLNALSHGTTIRGALFAAAVACGALVAMADDLQVSSYTISSGGGYSAGGAFELEGTIGQPVVGAKMIGGDLTLAGGFWHTIETIGSFAPGDCDYDGDVDISDFASMETCLFGPSALLSLECTCFDLNTDGHADLSDFAAFQQNFTGS